MYAAINDNTSRGGGSGMLRGVLSFVWELLAKYIIYSFFIEQWKTYLPPRKKQRAIHFITQWKSKRELERKFWNFSINEISRKIEFYCSFLPPQIYLMQIPSLNWNMNGTSRSSTRPASVCFETQMDLILHGECLLLTAA